MLLRERSIERREFLYKEPGRSYLHARALADKPAKTMVNCTAPPFEAADYGQRMASTGGGPRQGRASKTAIGARRPLQRD
ncbi:hypothetical protein [Methylocystis sp. SC2]|uniref:hypothetical protein n=1 Tax=Methylocystis sp. (strain SC2) TaxID=187303 RepID=UPI0002FEE1E4|nr:hypothetical protein [Methylocystis sp. SC2]